MNCANCSALLCRKKLISFHIINLLSLYYVLLGSFCHHHHHHHFRHIVHIMWRLFSILSILSCFCLYYSVLPFKINNVVQNEGLVGKNYVFSERTTLCYQPSVCCLLSVCLSVVCLGRWCTLLRRLNFSAIFFTIR